MDPARGTGDFRVCDCVTALGGNQYVHSSAIGDYTGGASFAEGDILHTQGGLAISTNHRSD
jgi:hypothetical protein